MVSSSPPSHKVRSLVPLFFTVLLKPLNVHQVTTVLHFKLRPLLYLSLYKYLPGPAVRFLDP